MAPDDKVYVIDLKTDPPKLAGTMTVGKQPSGLSFNPPGDLALVANSADKSISVLAVKGTDVKVIDTIDMGDMGDIARRKIFAGRQLSRPGRIHPQSRWRDHHEHRQTFQAAWPSGLDWDEQAITERDVLFRSVTGCFRLPPRK
jgi:hypothetical protein